MRGGGGNEAEAEGRTCNLRGHDKGNLDVGDLIDPATQMGKEMGGGKAAGERGKTVPRRQSNTVTTHFEAKSLIKFSCSCHRERWVERERDGLREREMG